jgi:hypothetical protein
MKIQKYIPERSFRHGKRVFFGFSAEYGAWA